MTVLCVNSTNVYTTLTDAVAAELPSSFSGTVEFQITGTVVETSTSNLNFPAGETADDILITANPGEEFTFTNGNSCARVNSTSTGDWTNNSGKPLRIEMVRVQLSNAGIISSVGSPIQTDQAYLSNDAGIDILIEGVGNVASDCVLVSERQVCRDFTEVLNCIVIKTTGDSGFAIRDPSLNVINNAVCHNQSATGQIATRLIDTNIGVECDYCASNDDSADRLDVGLNGGIANSDPALWFVAGGANSALSSGDFSLVPNVSNPLFNNGDGVNGTSIGPDAAYSTGAVQITGTITGLGSITSSTTTERDQTGSVQGIGELPSQTTTGRAQAGQLVGIGQILSDPSKLISVSDNISGRGRTQIINRSERGTAGNVFGIGSIIAVGNAVIGDDVLVVGQISGVGNITGTNTSTSFTAGEISETGSILSQLLKTSEITGEILSIGLLTGQTIKEGETLQPDEIISKALYNDTITSAGTWRSDLG